MTRGEFDRLVQRYRVGGCTPEEIAFVERWMEANKGDYDDDSTVFTDEADAFAVESEVWDRIRNDAGLAGRKTSWLVNKWFWGSIAASFLVAVSCLFFWNRSLPESLEPELTGLETINTSTNRQRIRLPDSSFVILAEGASIAVSEGYGRSMRAVSLKGEAFFEIKPNPKIPFFVYSGELVTEVLGTSFTIKPEAGKKCIEVSVTTGKVSVYSRQKDRNQRRRGVIITPNQKAVFDMESKEIRHDLVDNPKMIEEEISESAFDFDEAPVRAVLWTLQHSYGMDIVVSNPELNDCIFTGNLNGYDLFKQLSYVCDIINAQYEVRGTTIFLTGEGCSPTR